MRRDGQPGGERPDAVATSSRGPMILTGPIAGDRPVVFRVSGRTELNGPDLLIQVCLDRGWILFDEDVHHVDNWNIWWRNSHFSISQHRLLQPWQFVNHIPRANSICRKDCLARHLQRMNKVYGNIYNYSPQTYNLPLDYTKLVAEYTRILEDGDKATWICKPVGASQGKGITIFSELSTLQYDSNAVVQRYISNPLLIAGYKFDLRIYACIPSYHPLTVYLYEEGLARFSTEKYNMLYLDNKFSHLTNTSLNKLGPAYFVEKERIGAGSKWTLSQLRHYFRQAGVEDWLLWQRVNTIVSLTVLSHIQDVPVTRNCYELYGFDILVDSDLRPWLMEVNLSPSLTADSDVDIYVKKPLLNDLFDLIGLPTSLHDPTISPHWPVPDEKLFTRPKTVLDIREQNAERRRKKVENETDETSSEVSSKLSGNNPSSQRKGKKQPLACPAKHDDAGSDSDTDSWPDARSHLSNNCLKVIYSTNRQMSTDSVPLDCWRNTEVEVNVTPRSDTTCAGSEPGLVERISSSDETTDSWMEVRSRRCASRESSEALLRSAQSRSQPPKKDLKTGRVGSSRAASVDNLLSQSSVKWSNTETTIDSGSIVSVRKLKSKDRVMSSGQRLVDEDKNNNSRHRSVGKSPSEDLAQSRSKRSASGTTMTSDRSNNATTSNTASPKANVVAEIDRRLGPQNSPEIGKADPKVPVKVKTFLEKLRAEKENSAARVAERSRQEVARVRRPRRNKRNPYWGGDEGSQTMASAVTVLVNELGIITTLRPVSNNLPAYLTCQTHYLVPKGPQPAPSNPWVKVSTAKPAADQICKPGGEEREMLMLAYNWHAFHNKWGNGRDWRFAPPKVGGWCRTFPFNADTRHACEDPIDSKAIIHEVSAYLRFARKIALQAPKYDPEELTRQFKTKYCRHSELWMPCT